MTTQEFSDYLTRRLKRIADTLDNKHQEYADRDNNFSNFQKGAEILKCSKEEVMLMYATKHLVSVIEITQGKAATKAQIEEKFGDLVNYLILIEASLLYNEEED
jgi:hypothetical protein